MKRNAAVMLLLGMLITGHTLADVINVAAAANLTHVLEKITGQFEKGTGDTVRLIFSSSGNLARQIIQGAPFEIFLSADESYVALLQDKGLTDGGGNIYGMGRLALFVPDGSPVTPDEYLSDLGSKVENGQLKRFAIANPEYAPYGVITRQALQNARIWDNVSSILVYGKSASQVAQFCLTGAVDAALIPYSLALLPEIGNRGRFVAVSETLYTPLRQRMVLMKNAGDKAKKLYDYILGAQARIILEQYGLGLPTDLESHTVLR